MWGGGALSETQLWSNSTPTSNFASQEVTLSDSIANYKYIKIEVRASTGATTDSSIVVSVDDLIDSQSTAKIFALAARVSGGTQTYHYCRVVRSSTNTKMSFGTSYRQNTTTTGNNYVIPLKISGLK